MIRPEVRIAVGIELHDGEAAPDFVLDAGLLECRDFRAVEAAHDGGIGIHRQAVQRIFREHHQIHGAEVAARLANHRDDPVGLTREVFRGGHDGQLQLHEPDDDAFRRFVESAKSVHAVLLDLATPMVRRGRRNKSPLPSAEIATSVPDPVRLAALNGRIPCKVPCQLEPGPINAASGSHAATDPVAVLNGFGELRNQRGQQS